MNATRTTDITDFPEAVLGDQSRPRRVANPTMTFLDEEKYKLP